MEMVKAVEEEMASGMVGSVEVVVAVVEAMVAEVHRVAQGAEAEGRVAPAAAVDFAVGKVQAVAIWVPAVDGELAAALAYLSDSTVEGSDRNP